MKKQHNKTFDLSRALMNDSYTNDQKATLPMTIRRVTAQNQNQNRAGIILKNNLERIQNNNSLPSLD